MKLVCLNLWGGKAFEPLMRFLKEESRDTDIFCFQEVFQSESGLIESRGTRVDLLADLKETLPGFDVFAAPIGSGYDNAGPVDFDITESNATFFRKGSIPKIDSSGAAFLNGTNRRLGKHETIEDISYNFQYTRFSIAGKKFVVANMHGIARPGSKLDTPDRLTQSEMLKDFLNKEEGAKILCGDFNLLPETQSIKMLENGMVNLIKTFGVERTRSKLTQYWGKNDFQKFADYVFVSPDVKVAGFSVPDESVSDHLPLVLEFS